MKKESEDKKSKGKNFREFTKEGHKGFCGGAQSWGGGGGSV